MGPRSVRPPGSARVAVLGSATGCGARLRTALAERGVPGSRVDLYAVRESEEPVLSEYDGEARLIQVPELQEIVSRDVVFVCERGSIVERLVALPAGSATTTIDLAQARPAGVEATVVHMEINPDAAQGGGRLLAVPHGLSTLLAELLHALDREVGCAEVVATILRPAADFEEPGVEELRQQTVDLLNFSRLRSEVFGRQLAFNVVPQHVLPDNRGDIERKVAREVAALLGWERCRLTVALAATSVFYGHTLAARIRCSSPINQERILEILDSSGSAVSGGDRGRSTPMDVATVPGVHVSRVTADGLGGFWLWAVAGDVAGRNVELAIRLAAEVCGL